MLFTNVISGPDPRDHVALRPKVTLPASFPGVEGLRIALSVDLGGFSVAKEIGENTRRVAAALAEAGAEIVEVDFAWTRELIIGAAMPHFGHMMGSMVQGFVGGRVSELSDYARDFVEQTRAVRASTAMFDAAKAEYAVQRELARVMSGYDALLCPTTAAVGLPAGDTLVNGIDIDGRIVSGLEGTLTLPFNISNRCPVLAVPSGHAENGMPTGVQIVGHTYDDATVFRIGKAVESLLPWTYTGTHRPAL
ncbi:amidase family protein [Microbacterium sp. LWO13-1.2]|uniref:amidase family protein n=1 Tax=Microbacterium sp. LWO13-1.2 TaxID=3135262 RepID=UPI0031388CB0